MIPPIPGDEAAGDSHAGRIVMRPETCSAHVRGSQVFIATVYDGAGVPLPKRRVEWTIEGPGSIVEVDDTGRPDRGTRMDSRRAWSVTNDRERSLTRGPDEFTIRPGQTWCVVTSAAAGETTVTANVTATAESDKAQAQARVTWKDNQLRFPPSVTSRAGGEHTLATSVGSASAGDYRIRYRIVDGPPAALASSRGAPVDSVTEAVAPVEADGTARVQISQPSPAAGTNRIAIDIIRPSRDDPDHFTVVSTGETRITWQAPEIGVSISAPKTAARAQDVLVTYKLTGTDTLDAGIVTLAATIPPGTQFLRAEPKAVVDGDDVIWTLTPGKQQSAQAVFRPVALGDIRLAATARTQDGGTSRAAESVTVTEAKLEVRLDGPKSGMVGEAMPFQATVTNTGDGPAEHVRFQARLSDGLKSAADSRPLEQIIPSLGPGQSRTIALSVIAKSSGQQTVQAVAAADGDLVAAPQSAAVQAQEAQLTVSAHGPTRGYIGQEATWQLAVTNTGDVPLENVVARASLPTGVKFLRATDGGKLSGRQVVWDVGPLRAREAATISVTAACDQSTAQSAFSATAVARPAAGRGRGRSSAPTKPVGPDRPVEVAFEIIGIPALQMSLKESTDPVTVGQRTTYTIRVKNVGTLAARKVVVAAEAPTMQTGASAPALQMKPVKATGPGAQGRIVGNEVTFPPIDSLAPNAEATFAIDVEALLPGDARFRAEVRSALLTQPLRAEEPTRILGSESRPPGQ